MIYRRNNQSDNNAGFRNDDTNNSEKAKIPADIITMLLLNMTIFGYVLYRLWHQYATPPGYLIALIVFIAVLYTVLIWSVCDFYLVDRRKK